jgi:diguanylate cyclase (GGDEF)-like protein
MFGGLQDLTVGLPVLGLASTSADSFLKSALDEVEAGLIVVGQDFEVEFINRSFHRMWALPSLSDGDSYVLADIVEHGRRTGLYLTDPASLEAYVQQRRGRLRLADGRVLRFECKPLPGGRRMMTFTDISDLVHTADQLRDLATIDDLTHVSNRRQFLQVFEREFSLSLLHNRNLSVLMIDADNFRAINERHGHAGGDKVLRALAGRMRAVVRHADLVGRLGGEEFAVALRDTALPAALETAERLRSEIAAFPFPTMRGQANVTVSVGVATRRPQHDNAAELLRLADEALYSAKARGRNGVFAGSTTKTFASA